ncbi:uncharacterized protein EDB91DRAFT_1129340 [Suillus paluster]|uniref:uncharacterized protein n=1 Tax=Suillus paluster TaxID=48578 RepID=UPI001B877317|nr:uncharacterized protein EDB91DRAFT_1129340 [Suillus paluster]KAG1741777.1 hypothetical protein EDB91DRAFT_1129340 [Suillus paluster]
MLGIGMLSGRMHIYVAHKYSTSITYNTQRISALAWNIHALLSGSRDRMVHHWDLRKPSLCSFEQGYLVGFLLKFQGPESHLVLDIA